MTSDLQHGDLVKLSSLCVSTEIVLYATTELRDHKTTGTMNHDDVAIVIYTKFQDVEERSVIQEQWSLIIKDTQLGWARSTLLTKIEQ